MNSGRACACWAGRWPRTLSCRRRQLAEEHAKPDTVLWLANLAADSALVGGWRNELFVKQEQRLGRVLTADIHYAEASSDFGRRHTIYERLTVRATLKELLAKLPACDFARVHCDYLVRLDRIMAVENEQLVLDLPEENTRCSRTVPVGDAYKSALLGRLNQV